MACMHLPHLSSQVIGPPSTPLQIEECGYCFHGIVSRYLLHKPHVLTRPIPQRKTKEASKSVPLASSCFVPDTPTSIITKVHTSSLSAFGLFIMNLIQSRPWRSYRISTRTQSAWRTAGLRSQAKRRRMRLSWVNLRMRATYSVHSGAGNAASTERD